MNADALLAYTEFSAPIDGDFTAHCRFDDEDAWRSLRRAFERRRRARIHLCSELRCGGRQVARFEGDFVAIGASGG